MLDLPVLNQGTLFYTDFIVQFPFLPAFFCRLCLSQEDVCFLSTVGSFIALAVRVTRHGEREVGVPFAKLRVHIFLWNGSSYGITSFA